MTTSYITCPCLPHFPTIPLLFQNSFPTIPNTGRLEGEYKLIIHFKDPRKEVVLLGIHTVLGFQAKCFRYMVLLNTQKSQEI